MRYTKEVWKCVVGYEGLYSVSSEGRIRSFPKSVRPLTSIVLKLNRKDNCGYPVVKLYKESKSRVYSVHRVVLLAFMGHPQQGQEARHLDGDQTNNTLRNLRWGSHTENMRDSILHGTFKPNPFKLGNTHWKKGGFRKGHPFYPRRVSV